MFRLDEFLPIQDDYENIVQKVNDYTCETAKTSDHKLTIENVRKSTVKGLSFLLKPVGFYNKKAEYLKKIADQITDVPKTVKECVKLPGIGYKMANLIV